MLHRLGGCMSLFGNSKERSRKKAERFYEDALAYYEGDRDTERDVIQAVTFFRQAAERDHVESCRALGWMYLYEGEIDRDVDEAIRWYEKGVELGDMECAYNLAIVYCNEPEVQNYEKAFQLFCKVSEKGDANASYYRACFLRDGIGTEKREDEAVRWYEKAHQVGQPDAAEELACLWENRTVTLDGESETDCRKGVKYLNAAARWHEKAAQISGDEETQYARRARAEECRAASEEFRKRADKIRQQIQDAWMSVSEPKNAYRIVLGAEYDQGGRPFMENLQRFVKEFINTTEGAREDYHFFWFDNNGKCVEVICYYRMTKALEALQEGKILPDRFIALIPCDMGLTELVRMCMEACWEADCYSILPIMTVTTLDDWDDQELVRLFELDLRSFAVGNGAEEASVLYHATMKDDPEVDRWCASVFEPEDSWWKVPEEVRLKKERLAAEAARAAEEAERAGEKDGQKDDETAGAGGEASGAELPEAAGEETGEGADHEAGEEKSTVVLQVEDEESVGDLEAWDDDHAEQEASDEVYIPEEAEEAQEKKEESVRGQIPSWLRHSGYPIDAEPETHTTEIAEELSVDLETEGSEDVFAGLAKFVCETMDEEN